MDQSANVQAPGAALPDGARPRSTAATVWFPSASLPDISIIIPVPADHGGLEACLRSLAGQVTDHATAPIAARPAFDVTLVADAPTLPSLAEIPDSPGLRKLGVSGPGFTTLCNAAAATARGRILCVLDSNAVAAPGALARLRDALDATPGAGLAGGLVTDPSGAIKAAGWRILGNGSPVSARPQLPRPRRGARLPPRGGQPRMHRPGHPPGPFPAGRRLRPGLCVPPGGPYERAGLYAACDLAFRLRARGLRTIYDPGCRVVHHGTPAWADDGSTGAAADPAGRARFTERFATALARQPHDTGDAFALRHGPGAGPVMLVAGDARAIGPGTTRRLLGALQAAGWCVVFAPLGDSAADPVLGAGPLGIEVVQPPDTAARWITENGRHVRAAWLCGPDAADLVPPVRRGTDAVVIHGLHEMRHNQPPGPSAAGAWQRDRAALPLADAVVAPTEATAAALRPIVPGTPVHVLDLDAAGPGTPALATLRRILPAPCCPVCGSAALRQPPPATRVRASPAAPATPWAARRRWPASCWTAAPLPAPHPSPPGHAGAPPSPCTSLASSAASPAPSGASPGSPARNTSRAFPWASPAPKASRART